VRLAVLEAVSKLLDIVSYIPSVGNTMQLPGFQLLGATLDKMKLTDMLSRILLRGDILITFYCVSREPLGITGNANKYLILHVD
jgi:hypothetical protein